MSKRLINKVQTRNQRQKSIRAVVKGTPERPRLAVHISNQHITAQLVDDTSGKTLGYVTTVGRKSLNGSLTAKALQIGEEIATQAKGAKIKRVVFDRGGRLYHGRVATLADAARKAGLEF